MGWAGRDLHRQTGLGLEQFAHMDRREDDRDDGLVVSERFRQLRLSSSSIEWL